jgi:mxaJ protein
MYSRFLSLFVWLFVLICVGTTSAETKLLRVCADPHNLPFSDIHGHGFENELARMLAKSLGQDFQFVWQRMGRGFVREFMDTGKCDLVVGIPSAFRPLLTSEPYYRSSYVFLTARSKKFRPASLDDPDLKKVRIGVAALQEDYTPPAAALARRGLQSQVVGIYSVGSHSMDIAKAVSRGEVDLAIMWGPIAGYAVKRSPKTFSLAPVQPEMDGATPFTFAIAMGVRKGNRELQSKVNAFIDAHHETIAKLLDSYGVPQLPLPQISSELRP